LAAISRTRQASSVVARMMAAAASSSQACKRPRAAQTWANSHPCRHLCLRGHTQPGRRRAPGPGHRLPPGPLASRCSRRSKLASPVACTPPRHFGAASSPSYLS
jgi:hypothetical protein